MKKNHIIVVALTFFIQVFHSQITFAWYDETHIAVAKIAGYYKWYNAAGADIAKIKAGSSESYNHFYDNPEKEDITPDIVLGQASRYNNPRHRVGHLYGAIIASLRNYRAAFEKGKYAEYHLAFCIHYITDLSQPLHNVPYDDFNKERHAENDGIVNSSIMRNLSKIKKHMYPIKLRQDNFEADFAGHISRIANLSRKLGYQLKEANRNMTNDEAYKQLGHSASLLEAVLIYLKLAGDQ